MKTLKFFTLLTFLMLSLGTCIYRCNQNSDDYALLRKSPDIIKAITIDEKNSFPNRRAVYEFSYSYQFSINGKVYKGVSSDVKLKVGDTILVRYLKSDPNLNMPANPKWP